MKKTLASLFAISFAASCSLSNTPNNVDTNNVNSVNIAKVNKIQENNSSIKVNLKLNSIAPKFGIKSWAASGNLSRIHLKLHTSTGPDPASRFDNAPLASANSEKNIPLTAGDTFSSGTLTPSGGITFNNLKVSTSYYLSARVYSSNFNNKAGTVTGAVSGNTISGSGTSWNTPGQHNQLFKGDVITIGSTDKYTVVSVDSDSTVTVYPNISTGFSGSAYLVDTNVTGIGSIGGVNGMAANGSAIGGGTATGLNGGGNEEYVQVNATGSLMIMNNSSFNSTSPLGIAPPNSSFDIAIQVMKELDTAPPTASTAGAVKVYQGDTATPAPTNPPEDITVAL